MERALVLRHQFFDVNSEQVLNACRIVGELCNLMAVIYLQQEEFSLVLELLKKAEVVTERNAAGRAVTYNNMACFHRRSGKLRTALKYTQKALKIEAKLESGVKYYRADTYLNACAILSQLGDHHSALKHAHSALISLQEELFKGLDNLDGHESDKDTEDDSPKTKQQVHVKLDRIAVLAIAYHNLGVEQEFLKKHESCLASYRKGMEIAEQYLGHDNPTTQTLRNAYDAAEKSVSAAKETKTEKETLSKNSIRKKVKGNRITQNYLGT